MLQLLGGHTVRPEPDRSVAVRSEARNATSLRRGFRGRGLATPRQRGVLGAALCLAWSVAAMSCAQSPRMATAEAPPGAMASPADPRARIEALDREISDALGRAQLASPAIAACSGAACSAAMTEPFATSTVGDPTCRPAPTDQCTSACTLAGSICDNQRKICELAQQLAGDDWAANKCSRARASCTAAHERCCGCVL